jgi:hypothetical protein
MSNEIATTNNNFPSQAELQTIGLIAKTAHSSGLYSGVGGESKILMILLTAKELGVGPCMALNGGIWNINGKVEISSRLMNSLIRRAGHSLTIIRSDDTVCTLLGKRSDGDTFECSFTMEEAKTAGLAVRDVWKKYPGDMLYNRCMSRLARRLFSDVIGNSYVEGEIREAKEVEKQLPVAECEDVTPEPKAEQFQTNSILIEKVNDNQALKLQEEFLKIDAECRANMWGYLKEKHGVAEGNFHGIPESQFLVLIAGIDRNKEKNKSVA